MSLSNPCNVLRNITLTFTPPAVAPASGYRVRWRVVGNPTFEIYPTIYYSSPIVLEGFALCNSLEVCVELACAADTYGPLVCVVIPPPLNYCIEVTSETGSEPSQECPGNDDYIDYTFTLKDSSGNIVAAPSAVTISYSGTDSYVGGGGTFSGSATINTGQTSVTQRVWTYQQLNGEPACPCPCPTQRSVDENSFSPSIASPYTISICP